MEKPDKTETFKRALSGATKAISGKKNIEIEFGGEIAGVVSNNDGIKIVLPKIPDFMRKQDLAISRGQADAIAMRIALSDSKLHTKKMPSIGEAQAIYEVLEQARVEALGAKHLSGLSDNLLASENARAKQKGFEREGLSRQDVPLAEAIGIIARSIFSNRIAPENTKGALAVWQEYINKKAGQNLQELAKLLHNQSEFQKQASELLQKFDLGGSTEDVEQGEEDEIRAGNDEQSTQADDVNEKGQTEAEAITEEEKTVQENFVDASDFDGDSADAEQNPDTSNKPQSLTNQPATYNVFTRQHDEIIKAEDLCDPNELERLRSYLDGHMKNLATIIARLANRLQRKLMAQQLRTWHFDLEEGMLDTARLSRIVVDPTAALSFKQEKEMEFKDTIVSILLDNSGSMRGRPIMTAAVCADILTRTLERCAVKTEILGFTTRAWKGGASFQDWLAAGKPANPGRLNDLRHIIYKSADQKWRRTKNNLGLMMREGLLKENIDGEALEWAYSRLVKRAEQRKILMVISDGAPVDDATQSRNLSGILEQHLHMVIDKIENRSEIELIAIGINHDVTRWYRRAVTITDVEDLGGTMTEQLAELFG